MTEHVDAGRLRDLTLELVEVESPTGDTAQVARLYARRLEQIGSTSRSRSSSGRRASTSRCSGGS